MTPQIVVADADYTVLTPLPGTTKGDCTKPGDAGCKTDLKTYVEGAFKLAIGISIAFVLINFIIGGFQYITSQAMGGKKDGRERIENSIKGLVLVAASWLILYTINPSFTNINFRIDAIDYGTGGGGTLENATRVTGSAQKSCPTCNITLAASSLTQANMDRLNCPSCTLISGLPMQAGRVNPYLESSTLDELKSLNNDLKSENVGWRITEAWPPTVNHAANCHYTGRCIDAGLDKPTASNINYFSQKASSNGLRAEWEVKTEERRQQLIQQGVTAKILVVPYITGEHFSVYND
jgi:Zn-finger nucleic acid-binding protein